jgi:hypothetical protein
MPKYNDLFISEDEVTTLNGGDVSALEFDKRFITLLLVVISDVSNESDRVARFNQDK